MQHKNNELDVGKLLVSLIWCSRVPMPIVVVLEVSNLIAAHRACHFEYRVRLASKTVADEVVVAVELIIAIWCGLKEVLTAIVDENLGIIWDINNRMHSESV